MKKIIAIVLAAILMGCAETPKQNEVITYEGWPIVPDADVEPVYVPAAQSSLYSVGDTVWIDSAGTIIDFPIRDAESRQPITDGLERVVLKQLTP